MSAPIVVVTGTDTGVGKTLVTAGLAGALTEAGVTTVAIKPVESGVDGGVLEDGEALARATGQGAPARALTRLALPVAPPVAAEAEGVELDDGLWTREVLEAATRCDLVLVEGAGGLLSPLTWETSFVDLAATWGATAIVVAANRLGVLNHTRLTLAALRDGGVEVRAVVLSDVEGDDHSMSSNAETLRRLVPGIAVVELPRLPSPSDAPRALAHLATELAS